MTKSNRTRRALLLCTRAGLVCALLSGGPVASSQSARQFALHDGETVVFYGDSITAQRLYTRFVEEFVLTRYPSLHITFINAGVPGDKVDGGYAGKMAERVHRDVEPFHPGMITVMLGMNDGWWGTESPEVDAYFRRGYSELLDALRKAAPSATLTLIRPTPYDEITHGTEFARYSKVIDDLANDVSSIAKERQLSGDRNVLLCDFHQPLIDELTSARAQSPDLAALIVPDRIHPSEAGHWVMAAQLLATWGIDPIVSSVTLNASTPAVTRRERTAITALATTPTGLKWTQQDQALPLPFDFNNSLIELLPRISKIAEQDRLMLAVEGLKPGNYQLLIDDKVRATFSATELQSGVNLALIKCPMVDQARDVDYSENQRMQLDQARFVLSADLPSNVPGDPANTMAENRLRQAEAELDADMRKQLQPKPHPFELRRE